MKIFARHRTRFHDCQLPQLRALRATSYVLPSCCMARFDRESFRFDPWYAFNFSGEVHVTDDAVMFPAATRTSRNAESLS